MKKKLVAKLIWLLVLAVCMSLVAAPTFAASPSAPTISGAVDGGHAAGCRHSHSSSCYSYGSHSYPSCYGGHGIVTTTGGTSTCSKCGGSATTRGQGCSYCGQTYSYNNGCPCGNLKPTSYGSPLSGTCSSHLTCTSSHMSLSCGKGTYYNCVKPTLTSVGGPNGWVKEPYTPVLNGSNINQVQVGSGAWTAPAACKITESGTYPIRVKSSSGHIMEYTITVNNVDQLAPEAPTYSLLDIIKAKLGR